MSAFDLDNFMAFSTSEASDTKYALVEEGEYPAQIHTVVPRVTGTGKALLNVRWIIDDEGVRQLTGQAEPSVYQTIWLDLKEDGTLDMGKGRNVQLGKLREAVNQNEAGRGWSPMQLIGAYAKIKIGHSIDKRDNETIQANVTSVAHL